MAYGVHWQINFVARNGDAYRIEVLQDGYNDDIVHLIGAENPIETSEDNSDDIFTPIRKQTGHLRIADTGYDLDGEPFYYTDMLPTNTLQFQVRLWQISTTDILRWVGYIRPDSLTSRLFEKVSIREFQLVCPLGTLYEIPVSFSNTKNNCGTVKTMGQILHTALSTVGVSWANVYKQNNVQYRNDLISRVSLINFISKNEPTHTTPSAGDIDAFTATWYDESTSWGNLVEEVCKFWGWTLYSRGYDLFIISPNQIKKFAQFAFADLTSESNSSLTDLVYSDIDIHDLGWASTNHTESRKLGYKNITIDADVNAESTVIDPDYQKADFSYWEGGGTGIVHVSGDGYLYVLRRLGASGSQSDTSDVYFDNYQICERRHLPNGYSVPFVIEYSDGWKNDDYKNKTEFSLKKGIVCYSAGQTSSLMFSAKTLDDICVPKNSVICIQASVDISYNPDPDFPTTQNTAPPFEAESVAVIKPKLDGREIKAALKIGDYWWDADNMAWTQTAKEFTLTVRDDGSIVSPQNTFYNYQFNPSGILWDSHYGSDGFCMYVNSGGGIAGRMKLIIYSSPNSGSQANYLYNCVLNSLSVSIYNQDSKLNPQNKDKQQYKGIGSTKFNNSLSVMLKMASGDKNKYGKGQVFTPDYGLLTTVPFRNLSSYVDVAPEQRLLERLRNAYASVSIRDIIEVNDDLQASLPMAVMVNHWASEDVFRPLCVTHNWREGTMKLTLINR